MRIGVFVFYILLLGEFWVTFIFWGVLDIKQIVFLV